MLQNRPFPNRTATLALLAIVALLWLNFAFIEHQYDHTAEHHKHHHCQLFSSGLHGASSATPHLSLPAPIEHFTPRVDYHFSEALTFAYLPRSPPLS